MSKQDNIMMSLYATKLEEKAQVIVVYRRELDHFTCVIQYGRDARLM
jgi:hypothetical protein